MCAENLSLKKLVGIVLNVKKFIVLIVLENLKKDMENTLLKMNIVFVRGAVKMLRIRISEALKQKAIAEMPEFDAQKTYNKFECDHNWIGYLGELVLEQHFQEIGFEHEWIPFIKQGTEFADFVVDGKTYDLKTSYGTSLNLKIPHFDFYVFSRMNKGEEHTLFVIGVISKEKLERGIREQKWKRVNKDDGSYYYEIPISDLKPFEEWLHERM